MSILFTTTVSRTVAGLTMLAGTLLSTGVAMAMPGPASIAATSVST